jgi:hypothetical protein
MQWPVRNIWVIAFLLFELCISIPSFAQIVDNDESKLYAESKQVNQFIRRFNGEEDEKGNRYYAGDKLYQSAKLRKKYLDVLFDESNKGISATLKNEFSKAVIDKPLLLDFHGGNWFGEVQTTFTLNGRDQPVTLYMGLEKDHLGSKWVIQKVYTQMFNPSFARDTVKIGRFLHPMSHELDFMNLRKAFENKDSVSQFTSKRFAPDYLSVFLYEIKKGNLKFKTVDQVKFHFFQINGWYLELAEFNRPGYNTGWLISSLVKLSTEADKNLLQSYIYNENR